MSAWLAWLAGAAVLGVVEMITLTFAAGLMAAAAVVAADAEQTRGYQDRGLGGSTLAHGNEPIPRG